MSHELATQADGRIAMAYTGATPWHGLGQRLPADAPHGTWVEAAGFGFKIRRAKVRYMAGPQEGAPLLEMPNRLVLMRDDTGAPLGIVSPRYKVVQPKDVMAFFEDLIDVAGFKMESAGVLFGGQQYWGLARVTEDVTIVPGDRVGGFLLLHSTADGSGSTTATFTTTRVVCNNTVRMALSEKDPGRVVLSHRSEFNSDSIKAKLGLGAALMSVFQEAAQLLAATRCSMDDAKQFVAALLQPGMEKPENVGETKGFKRILALFDGEGDGSQLPGVQGTAWGLVNAVTQYAERENGARTTDGIINSSWFGNADALKSKALRMALMTTA